MLAKILLVRAQKTSKSAAKHKKDQFYDRQTSGRIYIGRAIIENENGIC